MGEESKIDSQPSTNELNDSEQPSQFQDGDDMLMDMIAAEKQEDIDHERWQSV